MKTFLWIGFRMPTVFLVALSLPYGRSFRSVTLLAELLICNPPSRASTLCILLLHMFVLGPSGEYVDSGTGAQLVPIFYPTYMLRLFAPLLSWRLAFVFSSDRPRIVILSRFWYGPV